jgi:hypothetical protein
LRRSPFRVGRILVVLVALAALTENSAVVATANRIHADRVHTVVTGGIRPCVGMRIGPVHRQFVAGTVLVLEGHITWKNLGHGYRTMIFPRSIVARETVLGNTMYRFTLAPGRYVLTARLTRSNVRPFVQIIVKQQAAIRADIPNMCI